MSAAQNRLEIEADIWLAPKEAAEYAGHHPQTILKACRMKELGHCRRGQYGHIRIRRSEVDRWMRRHEVPVRRSARG